MISLLGPSGCGKSTLLKTVAGLLEAQGGDVCIEGSSVLNMPTEKRGAVIVFQDLRLFPNLSVEGNIEFSLKLKGISRSQREQRVRELLEIVKLPGMQKRKINELSGGQMQRVALARALAAQPRLLLLDEPFSSLDEQLREQMRSFVQELHQRTQTTIVMVTHDREEALSMSDRIALMIDGQIVQVDVPEKIYRYPISKRVSDYFGGCSYLSGQVKTGSSIILRCKCRYQAMQMVIGWLVSCREWSICVRMAIGRWPRFAIRENPALLPCKERTVY